MKDSVIVPGVTLSGQTRRQYNQQYSTSACDREKCSHNTLATHPSIDFRALLGY